MCKFNNGSCIACLSTNHCWIPLLPPESEFEPQQGHWAILEVPLRIGLAPSAGSIVPLCAWAWFRAGLSFFWKKTLSFIYYFCTAALYPESWDVLLLAYCTPEGQPFLQTPAPASGPTIIIAMALIIEFWAKVSKSIGQGLWISFEAWCGTLIFLLGMTLLNIFKLSSVLNISISWYFMLLIINRSD